MTADISLRPSHYHFRRFFAVNAFTGSFVFNATHLLEQASGWMVPMSLDTDDLRSQDIGLQHLRDQGKSDCMN